MTAAPVLGDPTAAPSSTRPLDTWPAPGGDNVVHIDSAPGELTALCPAVEAEQGDAYTCSIRYRPDRFLVESKSLKLFLAAFRNKRIGAEDLAAIIRDALVHALTPAALTVDLVQNVRGGHAIRVRAHHNGGVPTDA